MNIADDLVKAFNDGYEKGKSDAEAYLLHCGDTDEPQTNADRIRSMMDEELAEFFHSNFRDAAWCDTSKFPENDCMEVPCLGCILDWLKQEAAE